MSFLEHMYLLPIPVMGRLVLVVGWEMLGQSCTLSRFAPHLHHEENSSFLSLQQR